MAKSDCQISYPFPVVGVTLHLLQPRTQAVFSMLLIAGGRDPGECWTHGSQTLGAMMYVMYLYVMYVMYLLVYVISVLHFIKCNESCIYTNNVQILPLPLMDVLVAPKICGLCDQHSPKSLPLVRSVENRLNFMTAIYNLWNFYVCRTCMY